MTQQHPYNADLAHLFCTLSLAAEVQPLWEADDPKHDDLEDIFAIPTDYFTRIFFGDTNNSDAMTTTIQNDIKPKYEQIGTIRVGKDIIPDYEDLDVDWGFDSVDSFEAALTVMQGYTQRFTETLSNSVRYSFSNLLMGYGLCATDNSHGLIVLRGTVSLNEWLNNMNYQLVPFNFADEQHGRVHNGFRDIYKGIRGAFYKLFQEFDDDMPVYLVGHSLGGAVSQLAALDLCLRHPERAEQLQVYAFASPRAGNSTFAEAYNQYVQTSYRIVNMCDVVPFVPFTELGDFLNQPNHEYADTKGEIAYIHQTGNPIANHICSYYTATKQHIPTEIDASTPRTLS